MAEGERTIHSSEEKIQQERAKLEKLEASLVEEETALEKIQESLKGLVTPHEPLYICSCYKDKTQVFHDQIEAKQKELAPWEAKINKTKAELDIAVSEQGALTQKAEAAQKAAAEAELTLNQFKEGQQNKVLPC